MGFAARIPGLAAKCDQPGIIPLAFASGVRQAACFPCLSCTAQGFSCPRPCGAGRWALTPPFHPCPPTLAGRRRFIFCDTVRQRAFSRPTARVHHAARCLVVSGLSSKGDSEKQPPATVSGAASLSFNSLPLPATPEKGRRGQRAEGRARGGCDEAVLRVAAPPSEYRGGDCREGGAVRSEAH